MISRVSEGCRYGCLLLLLSLTGCKSFTEKDPAYHLAQGCYALQAYDSGRFLVASGDTGYQLADTDPLVAEAFFVKPSDLGRFMLYDSAGKYMAMDVIHIKRKDRPGPKVEWLINQVEVSRSGTPQTATYTLVSPIDDLRVLHNDTDLITRRADIATVSAQSTKFNFVPQPGERCTEYPEADLDAERSADFAMPGNPTDRVTGYVDYHAHIGFPKSMGGVVMSGGVFHPYGIEHALHDCDKLHGKGGGIDLLEMQRVTQEGSIGHSTRGYPHFDYWPNRDTVSHVTTYYKWLERAYLGGLRILVTHATGNPYFCQLIGAVHITRLEGDCSPADTVRLQTEYMYKLQDYIDAQSGGPGKGWFRIVTTPGQAREVINQNKLAVVLGSEYSVLFDCRSSNEACDAAFIDGELQKLHDMGIRSVFPIHRFDNAFGGAQMGGGSGAAWMHLTSKMSTGHIDHLTDLVNPWKLLFKPIGGEFFEMEECPEGVRGEGEVYSMRKFIEEDFSFVTNALRGVPRVGKYLGGALDFIFVDKLEPIPDYAELAGSPSSCNVRTLQPAGQHLVNRIIDKGMILEIDHMSYATTLETMKILEARHYSGVVSSHGWLADHDTMLRRLYRLGGLAVASGGTPSNVSRYIQHNKHLLTDNQLEVGFGIGSDIQAVTSQPGGDPDYQPEYPITSHDGKVTFYAPQTGDRLFDFRNEGIAHYGLYAEWVDNLRQVSQQQQNDSFEIFMNSAEAYLQMWERAQAAAIE
ncbi:MAG: hypothetical protein R3208_12055 [Ketobacteraceae bacterium]|nr:hypothetical protein [Ketobacteraceae bacterium]